MTARNRLQAKTQAASKLGAMVEKKSALTGEGLGGSAGKGSSRAGIARELHGPRVPVEHGPNTGGAELAVPECADSP